MTLAVGFFDGVHLGHQRILAGADAALTFTTHPFSLLSPDRVPPLISAAEDRLDSLRARVGHVLALDFTPALAQMPPEDFPAFLRREFGEMPSIRCGANWTFGVGGRGNPDFLRSLGLSVEVVPYAEYAGFPVSSTRVRSAISTGDLASVEGMLGRRHCAHGRPIAGKGLGRDLGFPTVNLALPREVVSLPHGVWHVLSPLGEGIANWGLAPTAGDAAWPRPMLEVHVFGGDIGDKTFDKVEFLRFIRPERKFDTFEELRNQILCDIRTCEADENSI